MHTYLQKDLERHVSPRDHHLVLVDAEHYPVATQPLSALQCGQGFVHLKLQCVLQLLVQRPVSRLTGQAVRYTLQEADFLEDGEYLTFIGLESRFDRLYSRFSGRWGIFDFYWFGIKIR